MGALREFVVDMLESEGAAVDPVEPEGLDVLAPDALRAAMGWPELVRLGFGVEQPAGAIPVGLEGDWLDRFGALLGERGRFAERQIVLPGSVAPPNDPERWLERTLDLPNAVWRLQGVKPAWAGCLLLAFRYTAISDEKREGIIWLGFNCETGAVLGDEILGRLRRLLADDVQWHVPEAHARSGEGDAWDAAVLSERVRPLLDHYVRRDLDPFLRAMRRRLDRDCARVHEYHNDLRRGALSKLAGLRKAASDKEESERKRETMRVAAIEREYAAKLDDLRNNYALRVSVGWVQGLVLFAPVQRYEVLIKRRKGERIVTIDWHQAVRMMEPLRCDWGLGLERARLVCDEQLHLTGLEGQAPCASCGKAWCRACHGASCPRCEASAAPAETK